MLYVVEPGEAGCIQVLKQKIRFDGQKLQTEMFVFEFSELVIVLRLFLAATESYEGLNCTVLAQYLDS